MTQQTALEYCQANWGWEKRDCTLAKNRWNLMGKELIEKIVGRLVMWW